MGGVAFSRTGELETVSVRRRLMHTQNIRSAHSQWRESVGDVDENTILGNCCTCTRSTHIEKTPLVDTILGVTDLKESPTNSHQNCAVPFHSAIFCYGKELERGFRVVSHRSIVLGNANIR